MRDKTRRRGKSAAFEELVAWIHEVLQPDCKVEVKKRLRDRTNGRFREVDVAIEMDAGPTKLLTIVEARRRRRRVGSDYVDEVASRRDSLGADVAAVASLSGFTSSALRKATALRIRCFEVRQTSVPRPMVDWLDLQGFVEMRGNLRLVETWLETSPTIVGGPPKGAKTFEGTAEGNQAFAWEMLDPMRWSLLEMINPDRPHVIVRAHFIVPDVAQLWCRHPTEGWRQVSRGTLIVDVATSLEPLQFSEQVEYVNAHDGKRSAEIQVAKTEIWGEPCEVSVARSHDGEEGELHIRIVGESGARHVVRLRRNK